MSTTDDHAKISTGDATRAQRKTQDTHLATLLVHVSVDDVADAGGARKVLQVLPARARVQVLHADASSAARQARGRAGTAANHRVSKWL